MQIKKYGVPDVVRIRALIKNPPNLQKHSNNESLLELFEEYIIVTGKKKRSKVYTLKSHLQNFIGEQFIRPIDVDFHFLNRFETHLRKTNGQNSTRKLFDDFKSFFNYLNRYKDIPVNKYLKDKRIKGTEPYFVVLTQSQVNDVWNYKTQCDFEDKIRDIFLILCYTGLAWIDYTKGEFDIDKKRIKGRRSKTGTAFNVPLNDKVLKILSRNGCKPQVCLQVFNRGIKNLLAKIPSFNFYKSKNGAKYPFYDLVSSHTGRHTFIDIGLRHNWPIQTLMTYVGHSNAKQLLEYAKKHLTSDNDYELINQL